jgi:hypothetical protein
MSQVPEPTARRGSVHFLRWMPFAGLAILLLDVWNAAEQADYHRAEWPARPW